MHAVVLHQAFDRAFDCPVHLMYDVEEDQVWVTFNMKDYDWALDLFCLDVSLIFPLFLHSFIPLNVVINHVDGGLGYTRVPHNPATPDLGAKNGTEDHAHPNPPKRPAVSHHLCLFHPPSSDRTPAPTPAPEFKVYSAKTSIAGPRHYVSANAGPSPASGATATDRHSPFAPATATCLLSADAVSGAICRDQARYISTPRGGFTLPSRLRPITEPQPSHSSTVDLDDDEGHHGGLAGVASRATHGLSARG